MKCVEQDESVLSMADFLESCFVLQGSFQSMKKVQETDFKCLRKKELNYPTILVSTNHTYYILQTFKEASSNVVKIAKFALLHPHSGVFLSIKKEGSRTQQVILQRTIKGNRWHKRPKAFSITVMVSGRSYKEEWTSFSLEFSLFQDQSN